MVASLLYAFFAVHVRGQPLVVAVGGRDGQPLLFVIVIGGGGGWHLSCALVVVVWRKEATSHVVTVASHL